MPSPYERQCPVSTVASAAAPVANSAARRDFPAPASAEQGDDVALALAHAALIGLAQRRELALPADQRSIHPTGEPGSAGSDAHDVPGPQRLGGALGHDRLGLHGLDGIAHQLVGGLADQHLPGARRLLEPGGDIDRTPGHEGVSACDDLTGVDADPGRDREPLEFAAHLDRRPDGPQSVVLVQVGHAEERHHRVAHELLDGAAVTLDHGAHGVEVLRHDRTQGFGIESLGTGRGPRHVAEQGGDDLAHVALRLVRRRERQAARVAEAGALGVLLAASRTHAHGASVCRQWPTGGPESA